MTTPQRLIDVTPPAFHREISTIEFANGVVAAYNDSWCSTGKETPWNGHWRFECERGVIWLHGQWRNYR
ncbi:MAG: hypothetical protein Fur0044_35780 [Anaerolineae bacterium]|nr:hypothetical protein [Anaerolineales bacterium]